MDARAQALEALFDLIRSARDAEPGAGEFVIRCNPGDAPMRLPAVARRHEPQEVESRASDPEVLVDGADDPGVFLVTGVTSSTSVDWYGTEMSRACLEDMQRQLQLGVDLFPRHGGLFDPVEWDEVLGRTVSATLQSADVADPADPDETGFILSIEAEVDKDQKLASELERRLRRKQPIGLSIGGWFLEVRYTVDEDGDIDRIIVERVLLDHTAVVRSPANPDSTGLELLRAASSAMRGLTGDEPLTTGDEPEPASNEEAEPVTRSAKLDTDPDVGEDAHEGNHADTGNPPTSRSDTMSTEKMDQILAVLGEIRSKQDATDQRIADLEAARSQPTPEPTPEPVPASDEAAELRARIAALETERDNRDAALASLTGRSGRAPMFPSLGGGYDTEQSSRDIDILIERAKANGDSAPVLCATVNRHKASLSITREANGMLPRGERGRQHLQAAHNAPNTLRSILIAAEHDGLIGDLDAGWRS